MRLTCARPRAASAASRGKTRCPRIPSQKRHVHEVPIDQDAFCSTGHKGRRNVLSRCRIAATTWQLVERHARARGSGSHGLRAARATRCCAAPVQAAHLRAILKPRGNGGSTRQRALDQLLQKPSSASRARRLPGCSASRAGERCPLALRTLIGAAPTKERHFCELAASSFR